MHRPWCHFAWLLLVSALAGTLLRSGSADAARPTVRLAVPSYFRTAADWNTLVASADEMGLALINPNSGPGTVVDPLYAATATRLRSAQIRPVGYISTQYGRRSVATVTSEMARYRTLYGITSFFLDESPNVCSETVDPVSYDHVAYYGQIFDAAHAASPNVIVVLNPGTDVPECFAAVSDVIVNFEASASTYADWSPSSWVRNYPSSKFWHLVHSVGPNRTSAIVATAAERHAGFVYATTDVLPNPWDSLGDTQSFHDLRTAAASTARASAGDGTGPAPAPGPTTRDAAGAAGAPPAGPRRTA